MFIFIMFLHFISDFLFQSREIAEKKSSNWKFLTIHCLIIFAVFFIGLILIPSYIDNIFNIFLFCILYSVSHFIQDAIVWRGYKYIISKKFNGDLSNFQYWKESNFYDTIGLDQLLHTSIIYILWNLLLC